MARKQLASEALDKISFGFRNIIKDHLRLLNSQDGDDFTDMDRFEDTEQQDEFNINVIAYNIAFLIYHFREIGEASYTENLDWSASQISNALTMGENGRLMNRNNYYSFRDKLGRFLEMINVDLTKIDEEATDVWKHSYDKFDRALKNAGIPNGI